MEDKAEIEEKEEKKPTPLFKTKKVDRVYISKEESIRRMETIGEWRKKRLEELRAKLRAEGTSGSLLSDPE